MIKEKKEKDWNCGTTKSKDAIRQMKEPDFLSLMRKWNSLLQLKNEKFKHTLNGIDLIHVAIRIVDDAAAAAAATTTITITIIIIM